MTNRVSKTVASLAVTAAMSLPALAEEVTGSAGADVTSAYIFRGGTVNDEVNVQPFIDASAYGVTVGTWANFNTDASQFDEIDYYVGYELPLGEDVPVSASLGYTEYTFPTGEDDEGVALEADREISLSLGLDTLLAPSLFVGYGLEGPFLDEGIYIEASVGHDLEITEDLAVSLGASIGYEAGDNYDENGFSHALLSAGTGFGPLSISVNYVVETDSDVLEVDEDFFVTIGASI